MTSHCSNCGTRLPDGVGEALCPICALRGALGGSETDSVPAAARFVGGYELLEQIARGGMGVVYRARQLDLDRIVAVKMILAGHFASDEARTRFRAEAVAAARLRHPNIGALHEVGEHEGQPYFSMDYVEGRTLAEVIRDGTLPARRAATYLEIIAEAIEHAHSQGVLHRDLKPSNVIIDVCDQPRITDFGLAKQTAETDPLTAAGEVFGSPGYMSPEQALGTSGRVSAASDVYSLGALLYHLLTGVPPFRGETLQAILLQVLNRDPFAPRQINPNLPVDLETICLKCLEKEPARRYATARELAEDLGRFLRDEPVRARPLGAPGKALRWSRRHPALALLLGTVLLLLIAVAIISTLAAVRIKDAERKANANLRDSLLAQARAVRLGGRPGQRFDSLLALQQALPLDASPEFRRRVRSEVCSSLALADARFVPQPQLPLPFDATMGVFDPRLDYFARAQQKGLVTIHRTLDGQEIHRFETRPHRIDHVMALSPDTAFLALRHGKEVGVWEVATGRLCVLTNSYLRQFAFSADSRRVAIASTTGGLAICELPTGTAVAQWSAPVFRGEPPRGSFLSVAFSPDGRSLALGRGTEPIVEVRDIVSGNVLKSLAHSARIYALVWSRDGELLAGGCMDGTVLVWRAATGALERRFDGHTALVEALAFHPAGDRLASISDDRTIRFWHVASGESELALPAEGFAAAFSSDGQRFGPAWQPGHIGLVEFTTPREFHSFRPTAKDYGAFEATFSPDNRLTASLTYEGVLLWEGSSGRQLARLPTTDPKFVRFHPHGDAIIVSAPNGINRWPLQRKDANSLLVGPPQLLFSGPGWQDLAFDRQGARLLAADPARALAVLSNSAADGWTITFGPQERASAAALSPDGHWAATGSSATKDVCIWDTTTGQRVHRFDDGQNWQVAFSADGRWLATFRKNCLLWETSSWKPGPVLPLPKENTAVAPAAFAPDSHCIAFVLDEREVHLFSLPEPKLLAVLTAPNGARIRRLEFSPDGSMLAAACPLGEVQLWDLRLLRSSLARMNLDWEAPPLPGKVSMETNAVSVRVLQP